MIEDTPSFKMIPNLTVWVFTFVQKNGPLETFLSEKITNLRSKKKKKIYQAVKSGGEMVTVFVFKLQGSFLPKVNFYSKCL